MRIKNKPNKVAPAVESVHVKRKRGRPKCNEPIAIPNISDPIERKKIEARIKNNEASRRSRQRRNETEMALEVELQQLEQKHKNLLERDVELDKEIHKWVSYIYELKSHTAEIYSIVKCLNECEEKKKISMNKK